MTGLQKAILVVLAVFVITVFSIAAFMARPLLTTPADSVVAQQPSTADSAAPTPTPTPTLMPTSTSTSLPTDTPLPTPTATQVVVDTATPTPAPTLTYTLVAPGTPTEPDMAVSGASGSGVAGTATATRVVQPTATPVPSYPFKVVESQLYDTENSFFVLFAQIKSGGALVAGYRIVGTHSPSGQYFESAPSCHDLCKASGPKASATLCCNEYCTPEAGTQLPAVQEGNVVFEAPIYETGVHSLVVTDPQGQQVLNVIEIPIDFESRKWFYYVIAQ